MVSFWCTQACTNPLALLYIYIYIYFSVTTLVIQFLRMLLTPVLATATAKIIAMDGDTMECEFECKWDCAHCHLMEEYCNEDGINWEKVCRILQEVPELCSVKDDWDWYPLHFACYHNAPLSVIATLVNFWPEGLNETVGMENKYDGSIYYAPPLEIACGASAPDEVILLLAKMMHQKGYELTNLSGEILMDMNRDLGLIKRYMMIGNGTMRRNICSIHKKRVAHTICEPSTACNTMMLT